MPSCQQRPANFLLHLARADGVRVFPYLSSRPRPGTPPRRAHKRSIFNQLWRFLAENMSFLDSFGGDGELPQGVRIFAGPAGLIHRLSTSLRVDWGAAHAA